MKLILEVVNPDDKFNVAALIFVFKKFPIEPLFEFKVPDEIIVLINKFPDEIFVVNKFDTVVFVAFKVVLVTFVVNVFNVVTLTLMVVPEIYKLLDVMDNELILPNVALAIAILPQLKL